jgi:hypothetical protein
MAGYSSYSFKSVKKQFGLKSVKNVLFQDLQPVEASPWLVGTLEKTMKMAVISEKSRSEWLVSPIMIEIKDKNARSLNILSGENLDVDKELSLTGNVTFFLYATQIRLP